MIENTADNTQDDNILTETSSLQETTDSLGDIIKAIREQNDNRDIYIEQRTIYNYGVYTGDNADFKDISINNLHNKSGHTKYKNILNNKGSFCSWLSKADKYSIALLISCAVFHNLDYDNVRNASKTLCTYVESGEKDNTMVGITGFLQKFGIEICRGSCKTYSGKVDIDIVRFMTEEAPKKVLEYTWMECPDWRDIIVKWLKSYIMKKPIVMAVKASAAIEYIAERDYFYFQNKMLYSVLKDHNIATDIMIANVFVFLINNTPYKDNINTIMCEWNKHGGCHNLLVNLYVFGMEKASKDNTQIMNFAINRYINEILKEVDKCKVGEWTKYAYDFFAAGMRSYTYYKVLVNALYQIAQNHQTIKSKENLIGLFLLLYGIDIDLTNFEKHEDAILIKLCNSKQEVSIELCYLWQNVWKCNSQRKIFYELMADYASKADNLNNIKIFIDRAFTDICSEKIKKDILNRIYGR